MGFLGVYGHVNVDHILEVDALPGRDQTIPVKGEKVRLGGTGGNIARAAAALGVPTGLAAYVGDDFPHAYRDLLASGGIDLTDLRHVAGPTPKVWLLSAPDGSQSAVIDQGVMQDGLQRPRLDYTMMNSDWVHFTTGAPDEFLALATEAHRIGKRIAFDPAQELGYRYSDRLFERFLNQSSVFFCNEPELGRALEKLAYGDPVQLLDHTEHVLITRGPQGARLLSRKGRTEVPACPVRGAPPSNTVGAGDTFRAGFYAGLHERVELVEAVRWGCVAASLFLESQGERFPTLAGLRARRAEWRA